MMPEEIEQGLLADYLDALRVDWLHIPNEGRHAVQYQVKSNRLGRKKGAPDNLIFTPPPALIGIACGAAIELKRPRIGKRAMGKTSAEQKDWLKRLARLGWATAVCHGFEEAKTQLEAWGYGGGRP